MRISSVTVFPATISTLALLACVQYYNISCRFRARELKGVLLYLENIYRNMRVKPVLH